jgi:hypothetical protein
MRALLDQHFAEASSTKPTPEQLVAALVPPDAVTQTPAQAPKTAKPVVAKPEAATPAATTPEPAKSQKSTFVQASVTLEPSTVGTPNNEAQVDTGHASESPAAAPLSGPKPGKQKYVGAFHVQVGAYTSESDAEDRLGVVQQQAGDLLEGHLPFTTSFTKDGTDWYRARFAGFSKSDAQMACDVLKKMSVDCVVMKAE